MFSNKVYIIDKNGNKKRKFFFRKIGGIKIKFKGKNATVILHEPIKNIKKCKIHCGNNSFIEIGSTKNSVRGLRIFANPQNATCLIGKDFSSTSKACIVCAADKKVSVGDDCMFATQVMIRNTDSHIITDNDGNILNPDQDIIIGNHVWLGYNSLILKGAKIADNCVIGANSLINSECPIPNSVYAGSPAKLVKKDINWHR